MTTTTTSQSPLISLADAVALHQAARQTGGAVFMDVGYHLPASGRNAREEFNAARIAGAVFFDMDTIADTASPLPHTMPSAADFRSHMRAMGLNDGDAVVLYDSSGFYSAARGWYMLRHFGHADVRVLDGGFDPAAWEAAGGMLDRGADAGGARETGNFTARPDPAFGVITLAEMQKISGADSAEQILDARAPGRFSGDEPEPRPGMQSGHIPGSRNYPIGSLIDKETGRFLDRDALREKFADINPARPIITTCGSGVTACGLALGLTRAGMMPQQGFRLYDGSWSEWGSTAGCPIATGRD